MSDLKCVDAEATSVVTEPAGPLRHDPRRRILKQGIIAYSGRHLTVECAVRDLSEHGARLAVADPRQVPDTFELLIDLDGVEFDCVVAWRRSGAIGVRFTAPPRHVEPRRRQVIEASGVSTKPSLRRRPRVA